MSLAISAEPSSLVAVHDQCAAVEAWADTCESIPELQDATHKLAAIDEYLSLTSTEGRSRVAAAMRRLEARIGVLLGPPMDHDRRSERYRDQVNRDLPGTTKQQRHDFRQMAEHPEVVEEVIAASTDERPASRRKVTQRIKDAKAKHPTPTKNGQTRAEFAAKVAKAREMAAGGYTSRQITTALGFASLNTFINFRKAQGIEVPADAVVGKTRRHDSTRIVTEAVIALEATVMSLDLVDLDTLPTDELDGWVAAFTSSTMKLRDFARQMKEATRG